MSEDRKQWFIDRIGKRVFRNKTGCDCVICVLVSEKGLIITDEFHAIYLYDTETDFTAEGNPTHYFDTLPEVEHYQQQLDKQENL